MAAMASPLHGLDSQQQFLPSFAALHAQQGAAPAVDHLAGLNHSPRLQANGRQGQNAAHVSGCRSSGGLRHLRHLEVNANRLMRSAVRVRADVQP